jgi:hypothetical protein
MIVPSTPPFGAVSARTQGNSTRAQWLGWIGCLALAAVAFLATLSIGPSVAVPSRVAFVAAFTLVATTTSLTCWRTPVLAPARLWIAIVPSLALVWAGSHSNARGPQALVVLISLLALGSLVGGMIGSRVQAPGHLLFVALVSSAADIFSVYAPIGPTGAMIDSPVALNLLALPWPMLGTDFVPPVLGVGDVIFASLYRGAARAHQLSPARTLIALVVAFALTLAALLATEAPIPALPFLGLTFVMAHPQARHVPEADRKRGWIAVVTLLIVFGILAAYRR